MIFRRSVGVKSFFNINIFQSERSVETENPNFCCKNSKTQSFDNIKKRYFFSFRNFAKAQPFPQKYFYFNLSAGKASKTYLPIKL